MKMRESGMPDEAMWEGFFDPPAGLGKLGLTGHRRSSARRPLLPPTLSVTVE